MYKEGLVSEWHFVIQNEATLKFESSNQIAEGIC